MTGDKPKPIVHTTAPTAEVCGVLLREDLGVDPRAVDRICLMLAACWPGVCARVAREDEWGTVTIERGEYHSTLNHFTPALVGETLRRLAPEPVLSLARHPHKVYVWVLVLDFQAQRDHQAALRRIKSIRNVIITPDTAYDRYMLELFVPGLGVEDSENGEETEALLAAIRTLFNFKL